MEVEVEQAGGLRGAAEQAARLARRELEGAVQARDW